MVIYLPRSGLLEPPRARDGEEHAARDAGVRQHLK
jgi:glycine/D-amino acid oxidase-like deaminating enzyme